jgi:hypothetical protein
MVCDNEGSLMTDFIMDILTGIWRGFKYVFNAFSEKLGSFWSAALLILTPFLASFLANITAKLFVIPVQFTFLTFIYLVKLTTIAVVVNLVLWVYNQIHVVMDFINTNALSNDLLQWFIDLLKAVGFFQAFNDTFSTFSFVFVSLLVLFATRFFLDSMKLLSDELFKIGLLLKK